MDKREAKPAAPESEEYSRFERFLSALFRVDKRDVPKHEPTKRITQPRKTS
jgi:hypothetical protein